MSGLGAVFRWPISEAAETELVVRSAPTSNYAESFRQIRANFQFATAGSTGRAFLVCSLGPGEGKSTILCNLAVLLAQVGKRVLIIDGDLRRASVHRRFEGGQRQPGLSSFLADMDADLSHVVHKTEVEGLDVIPSGPHPPNPAELLGSPKMSALLATVKSSYDYVLLDSPPVLLLADAAVLAAQVDGSVVVVEGRGTRPASLKAALDTLRNSQTKVLGVIVNKLKRSRFGYGYGYPYYYYYYSSYYSSDSDEALAARNGRFYKLPARWVEAAISRLRRPRV